MAQREYKTTKEAFVSGTTGSTVSHVNAILAVGLSSVALHSALRTRFPHSKTGQLPTEVLLLVLPALLSITLSEKPEWLSVLILVPTGVLLCFPSRETGTPLPSVRQPLSPRRLPSPVHGESTSSAFAVQTRIPPLPALTTYRAYMLLLTFLSILAVDFPVFPRSLAKCETFGVSLMDLGVGGFVFSQGVVSSIPLLKDRSYLALAVSTKSLSALRKSLPIVVLGIVRVLLVKGTEYPEHESEYGTHWNFFITLAVLPILQILLHPLIAFMPVSMIGVLVALIHQISLSFLGLEEFILTASRTNVISANKEGIVSVVGYLSIHLLGLSTGMLILPASPTYFRRQQKARQTIRSRRDSNAANSSHDKDAPFSSSRQTDKTATELASYAVIWWTLLGVTRSMGIGTDVSRRMANLPYILWVAAVNTTFILAFVLLDMYFFPVLATKSKKAQTSRLTVPGKMPEISGVSPSVQASLLLEAINKNGLVLFLAANVATGLVNLSIPTMYTSNSVALLVLSCYACGICGIAWAFRDRRIWR